MHGKAEGSLANPVVPTEAGGEIGRDPRAEIPTMDEAWAKRVKASGNHFAKPVWRHEGQGSERTPRSGPGAVACERLPQFIPVGGLPLHHEEQVCHSMQPCRRSGRVIAERGDDERQTKAVLRACRPNAGDASPPRDDSGLHRDTEVTGPVNPPVQVNLDPVPGKRRLVGLRRSGTMIESRTAQNAQDTIAILRSNEQVNVVGRTEGWVWPEQFPNGGALEERVRDAGRVERRADLLHGRPLLQVARGDPMTSVSKPRVPGSRVPQGCEAVLEDALREPRTRGWIGGWERVTGKDGQCLPVQLHA